MDNQNTIPQNGILIAGKFYEAVEDEEITCRNCHLIGDDGRCDCRDFCFYLGRYNSFRFSQEITDKINKDGNR